jgi:Fic family protein
MPKRTQSTYVPPFTITAATMHNCLEIMQRVGRLEAEGAVVPQPTLRRQNQLRTIHGTLAIEGNSLSEAQMTAVMSGKRVAGPRQHVQEVLQTVAVYDQAKRLNPASEKDFLAAHRLLMAGLLPRPGGYRNGGVGIFLGSTVTHVAPPASQVPRLMAQLFTWVKQQKELPSMVVSSVFHYELEFIHPFADGNGRMGRLWQHVMLVNAHPIFQYIPVESIISARQKEYYDVLAACDAAADCSAFIEFCTKSLLEALQLHSKQVRVRPQDPQQRLDEAHRTLQGKLFSRQEYMQVFRHISSATASRDLSLGVRLECLQISDSGNKTRYRFVERCQLPDRGNQSST